MMIQQRVTLWTRIPDYYNSKEMRTGRLHFDESKCKKCDICAYICPARSIDRNREISPWNTGLPFLKQNFPEVTDCVACGCCMAACPAGAISILQNFDPGDFYRRLTQSRELTRPKIYLPSNGDGDAGKTKFKPMDRAVPPPVGFRRDLRQKINWVKLRLSMVKGAGKFGWTQIRHGRGLATIKKFAFNQTFDISFARLLEESAAAVPQKDCLLYNEEKFTYRQMDENANRLGNYLLKRGGCPGRGVGIILRNSPRFLDIFFGTQKIGMYSVPINPELKGDGLAYIVNHSDIKTLVVDAELLENVLECLPRFQRIAMEDIIVNDVETEARGISVPENAALLSEAYTFSSSSPAVTPGPEDICLIVYTSGTTGPPKGVVYRYHNTGVQLLCLAGNIFYKPKDIFYTYLSLCHGNALFITVTMSLAVKCTIALSRKFSASRFWDTVRQYNATTFNTIGTIIPILMKQPQKANDRDNPVRMVFSAACPLKMWEPFETRFGVELFEGYGAVDGGTKGIMNLGTAPPGSIGKPGRSKSIRIVDEHHFEVPPGVPGELVFKLRSKKKRLVEYYKNTEASARKSDSGWLFTGDIVKRDRKGYLYFVGRNTESMRKGGENVSAYEVEHVIMQHPQVEDAAVYAVPSDLGEDDIMAAVTLVANSDLKPAALRNFLKEKLAKYAVPRYIRFVAELPKTNTHRIIKGILEEEGVTEDTYDALAR